MAGAIGGALFQLATGYIVHFTHSYIPLFAIACGAYLLALVIIHVITPNLNPAHINLNEGQTPA
jgi:ACS family hexuronate transporter-like MFS transporter